MPEPFRSNEKVYHVYVLEWGGGGAQRPLNGMSSFLREHGTWFRPELWLCLCNDAPPPRRELGKCILIRQNIVSPMEQISEISGILGESPKDPT